MKPRSFLIFLLMAICWTVLPASASRFGDLRVHARFLTDRMAYELNLSNRQYDDVFEINYDFLYNVEPYLDGMSYGDPYSVDAYYRYLDERNDDLRWVLSRRRYVRFMGLEHFYLPIYVVNRVCHIRVYSIYPNRTYFYYSRPAHYYSYHGGHCRHSYGGVSFYKTNYSRSYRHTVYNGHYQSVRSNTRTRDFPRVSGNVNSLTNGSHSAIRRQPSYRFESVNSSSSRPATSSQQTNRTDRVTRPSGSIRPEISHAAGTSRPSVSRPGGSSRPSVSHSNGTSRPDREYRRPDTRYTRPSGLNTSHRESSTVRSNRSERGSYESSARRSTRSEGVSRRPAQRSSTRSSSTESRSRTEHRSHR